MRSMTQIVPKHRIRWLNRAKTMTLRHSSEATETGEKSWEQRRIKAGELITITIDL